MKNRVQQIARFKIWIILVLGVLQTAIASAGDEHGLGRMIPACIDSRIKSQSSIIGSVHSVSVRKEGNYCTLKLTLSVPKCGETRYIINKEPAICSTLDYFYKIALTAFASNTSLVIAVVPSSSNKATYIDIDLNQYFTVTKSI